ncbi:MAG: hypothetical protein IRZ16_08385 [Myxococcaceae bacterium]|nr:hypothetical protein [Myxococcaceae bacterium]
MTVVEEVAHSTPMKIGLFVLRPGRFDPSEFQRRRRIELDPGQSLYVKSPEDTVVRKLLWFREGGEVSTQQWRDVVEVLRVSGPWMDMAYVEHWSAELNLSDLLDRAKAQASTGEEQR